MGFLVGMLLGAVLVVAWNQNRTIRLLLDIKKAVERTETAATKPETSGTVTDPFTRPKERQTSSNHVIVPKTPVQIRNENFDKIVAEGKERGAYGRIG